MLNPKIGFVIRPAFVLVATVLGVALALAAPAPRPTTENPLIAIFGGAFLLGSDDGAPDEGPALVQELSAFKIQRYEVTNREYRLFAAASGHRPSFFDTHEVLGRDRHPVVGVSWDDANAYCRFYGLRLPTELEWERAARGPDGRDFAWGHQRPTATRTNGGSATCCGPDASDGYPATAPVGTFGPGDTPDGVADLTGNVWEWVDGWYGPHQTPVAQRTDQFRILRGGAWNSDPWRLRATHRLPYRGDYRFAANGGFRCATSA